MTENQQFETVTLSYQSITNELIKKIDGDLCSAPYYKLKYAVSRDPVARAMTKRIGVYLLFYNGAVFYVGKSTVEILLRLRKHFRSLTRFGLLDLDNVECQIIPVDSRHIVLSVEEILIDRHNPVLNGTNFGSNSYPARDAVEQRLYRKAWQSVFQDFVNNGV